VLACPSMLAELLAAASIAVGSMTAKTVTPPRPGGMVVAKDKLALGRLSDLLTGIASRMREASTPDDVPWLVSSKVFDPEFLDLIDESEALLYSTDLHDLVEHAGQGLPGELREIGAMMSVAFGVAEDLRARAQQEAEDTPTELFDSEDTPTELNEPREPTVDELIGNDRIPRRVRDAIYGSYASAVCTIALLDPRPLPGWLRAELQRRAVEGHREGLRLLLAVARRAGITLPPSPLVDALEPLDLDAAEREHLHERSAFQRGLAVAERLRPA
jgi:hypothetical protein